jgi:hypothetical protein
LYHQVFTVLSYNGGGGLKNIPMGSAILGLR